MRNEAYSGFCVAGEAVILQIRDLSIQYWGDSRKVEGKVVYKGREWHIRDEEWPGPFTVEGLNKYLQGIKAQIDTQVEHVKFFEDLAANFKADPRPPLTIDVEGLKRA